MIKVNLEARTVRETTCPYEFTDDEGNLQTKDIRVRYFSPTIADSKRERQAIDGLIKADKSAVYWYSESLVNRIESLPDLVDAATGKPLKITVEVLEALDSKNVERIHEAILEDLRPKAPGTK